MIIRQNYLILNFLIVIVNLIRSKTSDETTFQIETVRRISYVSGLSLAELNPHEQFHLCMAAKDFAVLDGMEPNSLFYLFDHEIEFSDGRKEIHTALRCPTVPIMYLRRGSLPNEIRIVLEDNKFLSKDYTFLAEHVLSVSRLDVHEDGTSKTGTTTVRASLLSNYDDDLDDHDAHNMCQAATERIFYAVKMNDFWSEIRAQSFTYEYYEFVYHNGKKVILAAIKCPTSPETYLRLGNRKKEFIVMVVFNEGRNRRT